MIEWRKIECALLEWAEGRFPNLDVNHFIWADQNLPSPPYPYLTLKRNTVVRVSAVDETRFKTDLSQKKGEEVTLETTGTREFTLSLQAFVDEETGSLNPDCDALFMLSLLQISLSQQSVRDAFCLAGLAVVEELAVTDLSQVINGEMISRASMDVRFRTTFTCVEKIGFIETVQIESVPSANPGPSDVTGVDLEVC